MKRGIVFGALAFLLVGAAGLMGWAGRALENAPTIAPGTLAKALPRQIGEWRGEDVPLGETEDVRAVAAVLHYDDYVYRVYRRGRDSIYVYAMHWRQGRISVREMAGHTPDGCWVANGASPVGEPLQKRLEVGGRQTAPAEVRTFKFPGSGPAVNVAWWHVWGGTLIPRSFASKTVFPMIDEVRLWLEKRRGTVSDQWLVRLHSDQAVTQVVQSEATVEFLSRLSVVFEAREIEADGNK